MSGRPVRLLPAAAIAAAVSLLSISTASAGCYSCGCGAAVTYSAPVVYSYTYSAPVVYAQPCAYASPMYVVNQGPAYTAPVPYTAEPTAAYGYVYGGYRRAYPYYAEGGIRWHRRHWHRGYGYRHGIMGPRLRYGYRHHGYRYDAMPRYRYGAVMPGHRMQMPGHRMQHHHMRRHHPMVGPGGIHRGPRHRTGAVPLRMNYPGSVHPMGAPK